jgi:hypothetical protein
MKHLSQSLLLLVIMLIMSGCGDEGPTLSTSTASPTGVVASLEWDPATEPAAEGYYVYYGKASPSEPGSCLYEHSEYVSTPSATITGLDPGTQYYFAVSTFNGSNSVCSEEISTITPAVQT